MGQLEIRRQKCDTAARKVFICSIPAQLIKARKINHSPGKFTNLSFNVPTANSFSDGVSFSHLFSFILHSSATERKKEEFQFYQLSAMRVDLQRVVHLLQLGRKWG
jgi:hypothetical protein